MNSNHRKALLKQVRVRSHHQAMLSELAMRSLNGFDTRRATNDWDNRSTFDDGRRLTGETLGNGVTETRTYSTDNLLTGISYGGTGTSIGNLSYTWDANKNKTSETIGGTMSGYGFTSAGTSYDDEDRLTGYARTNGTLTQSWNLTKVGDWTSVTTNGTAQNRTHGPTHELLTAGGQNVSTDVKGNITLLPLNLTPQSSPLALQWDFDNKLRGADLGNNSSVDVNFQYDALGRRVARTGTGGSVVYVQHDQQTIADYPVGGVASTPTNRYVYASYIDEPVVRKAAGTSGTIHYYHRNQQYSITAMTTSTGAVAERYAYTAYGQPTICNASGSPIGNQQSRIANRFTYTGREWDETLGLHHFRARWMSPLAGRFLGRDPIGYWDGSNLYPLYFVSKAGMDPLGWSVIVVVMPVMFTCGEFTQNLPDESELPHPSKEQWKHGPNLFCGNCNGFDAYAWKNPANGKCTICMSDQKSFSRLEWIGLLIHEMTHCEQDGCKGTKGGNPPSVIEPIPLPDPKNLPGSPLERCAACDNLERPAYTRQCKFLFPADVKKRDLCIEAGVCQSCKSYCDHNPKFVKKCNGLVMPSPWFPLF